MDFYFDKKHSIGYSLVGTFYIFLGRSWHVDWKEIIDRKVTTLSVLGVAGGLLVVYGGLFGGGGVTAGFLLLLFAGFGWAVKNS